MSKGLRHHEPLAGERVVTEADGFHHNFSLPETVDETTGDIIYPPVYCFDTPMSVAKQLFRSYIRYKTPI